VLGSRRNSCHILHSCRPLKSSCCLFHSFQSCSRSSRNSSVENNEKLCEYVWKDDMVSTTVKNWESGQKRPSVDGSSIIPPAAAARSEQINQRERENAASSCRVIQSNSARGYGRKKRKKHMYKVKTSSRNYAEFVTSSRNYAIYSNTGPFGEM